MRTLILLALLPSLALADGVRICTTFAAGACTATTWDCQEKLTSGDVYVRTDTTGWQKWSAISSGTNVRTCKAGASDSWLTKAASGVTVATVTPPEPPVVSLGDVLSWSADPLAKSYRVYRGTVPGVYTESVPVNGTRYQIPRLPPGTHYFAVSAYGATGIETEKAPASRPLLVPAETPKVMTCSSATLTCTLQ